MSAAAAQSPAQRVALRALGDSLAAVRDRPGLLALEQATIEVAKGRRNDPIVHLRLGMLALRLAQLGERRHFDYAIGEFEWAMELEPAWPWPKYGVALAFQRSPNRANGFGGALFQVLGIDEIGKATALYDQVLTEDSTFVDAVLRLAEVSLEQRIDPPAAMTLARLRPAAARYRTPDLLQALGELERRMGSPDSALVAFARLRDTLGLTPAVLLEVARTLPLASPSLCFELDLPAGDSAYYMGAISDDSVVVAAYRSDIAPILDSTELAQFDARQGAERVRWLRAFWGERDARELREPGQRIGEHYRRWNYAMIHFRLGPFRRRYSRVHEPYRHPEQRQIDDRGVIYIRHGQPADRRQWGRDSALRVFPGLGYHAAAETGIDAQGRLVLRPPASINLPPDPRFGVTAYGNETWLYQQPDGDMVLHFAAHYDPDDYHLQATVFSLTVPFVDYDYNGSTVMGGMARSAFGDPAKAVAERVRGRRDNRLAVTTDSWTRTYAEPLPGRPSWFAAGSVGGRPLMHLVYAVNADALARQPWRLVPLKIRAAFLDQAGHPVATLDTVQMVERPASGQGMIAVQSRLPMPPGAAYARLSVEVTPALGVMHRTDTLDLPVVNGSRLDLSDLLLGRAGHSLHWDAAPGIRAWLDPREAEYRSGDTVEVFAEAYGVSPESRYAVTLRLVRKVGVVGRLLGKRESLEFRQEMGFANGSGRIAKELVLDALPAGEYALSLILSGASGSVTRERTLRIRER